MCKAIFTPDEKAELVEELVERCVKAMRLLTISEPTFRNADHDELVAFDSTFKLEVERAVLRAFDAILQVQLAKKLQ